MTPSIPLVLSSTEKSDIEKLAIHEAGHALMFDALQTLIDLVTIEAGCAGERSSFEGCVKLASDTNNVCIIIAGTLAGPAASFFIAREAMDEKAILKFRSDQKIIHDIYSKEKDAGSWDDFWLRLQTFQGAWLRAWLMTHQQVVERFANDLLAKKTLSGEELVAALVCAWDGAKPDACELRAEVMSVLACLLDDGPSSQPQSADSSDSISGMLVYRCVNQEHDPVEVGSHLTRTSNYSKQKLAEGMYFAVTREDALTFSRKDHGHTYTHLLTCRLKDVSKSDLVDLIVDAQLISHFKRSEEVSRAGLSGRELNRKYCEIHSKKGLLWTASANSWAEVCLFPEFVNSAVVIEAVEKLR
jgi:hypothetical protein